MTRIWKLCTKPRADLRNVDSNSQFSPEACTIFRQLIRCSFDVPEGPRVSARYQQQEALETAIFSPGSCAFATAFKRTGRPAGRTWREYSPGGQRNHDSSDPPTLAGWTSHSERRAISAFTCVARRAGNKHAARPATKITSTTAEKVHGSVAETTQIWLAITPVNARLIITPANAPAVIKTRPLFSPTRRTSALAHRGPCAYQSREALRARSE